MKKALTQNEFEILSDDPNIQTIYLAHPLSTLVIMFKDTGIIVSYDKPMLYNRYVGPLKVTLSAGKDVDFYDQAQEVETLAEIPDFENFDI